MYKYCGASATNIAGVHYGVYIKPLLCGYFCYTFILSVSLQMDMGVAVGNDPFTFACLVLSHLILWWP